MAQTQKLSPIHPGEILIEEFLEPMDISQSQLALDINIPEKNIAKIIQGKHNITTNIALRLSHYFSLSERFWVNLQTRYDIETEKDRLADRLQTEVRVYTAISSTRQLAHATA